MCLVHSAPQSFLKRPKLCQGMELPELNTSRSLNAKKLLNGSLVCFKDNLVTSSRLNISSLCMWWKPELEILVRVSQTGLYAQNFPMKLKEFEKKLTCKSCLAASAPALVLNVTKPTGCNKQTASQCESSIPNHNLFDLQFDIFLGTNSQAIE